ncbi:MAG: DNA ligase [Rubrivivax sp.]
MPMRRHVLAACATLPCWATAAPARGAAARGAAPALMRARIAPDGMHPRGWLVSEKLDGVRALWDGATLRLRSGMRIAAPPDTCAGWPARVIDGELWAGRGGFEAVVGTVRRLQPDLAAWQALRFCAFDLPGSPDPFRARAAALAVEVAAVRARQPRSALHVVVQGELPDAAALQQRLAAVIAGGGEGLMLHRADATWQAGRSDALLKLKLAHDAEARVIAHETGHGRLAGRLGALRVRAADGREFRLGSGFSDAERSAPPPVGSIVSYRYRGLTDAGLPRFASFLRRRPDGL